MVGGRATPHFCWASSSCLRQDVERDFIGLAGFCRIDVLPQPIGACQQAIGHGRRERAVVVDDNLQQVFHQMRELGWAIQPDRGRRTFDTMRRDEQLVDVFPPAAGFQSQQGFRQLVEGLQALVDEDGKVA